MNQEKTEASLKDRIKAKWSKLTDAEIKDVQNDTKALASKIQSTYGRTKEAVEKEVSEFYKSDSGKNAVSTSAAHDLTSDKSDCRGTSNDKTSNKDKKCH